jgi:hypothetical protein
MYPVIRFEPKIHEIGGEPLEGSGLETENPVSEFEPHAEEDLSQ